ncbi:MAG TPA: tetratricopeptide repeat protein [Burkholderiales bacterium]|nr:tetratricopeptide repeat protein [Burkholderiales bacterium]
MILRLIGAIGVALFAAACAQQPANPTQAAPAAPAAQAEPEDKAEPKPENLPKQELTEQLLFEFLVGEVASQQGDYAVAVSAYMDLAQRTRDPRVARRAAELALQGRYLGPALKASRLWLELEPDSVQARQALAGLLLSQGRLDEARQHLEVLIASEEPNVGAAFMHLNSMLARHPDRGSALAFVRDLAKPYPRVPEAHFAVAQAALSANQPELASAEIQEALALRPDWEPAALFQGQLLQQRTTNAAALEFYRGFLKRYPKSRDVRLAYARTLVADRQYADARKEFQVLVADSEGNTDVLMAVGLLSLQLKDLDTAEATFKVLLDSDYRDPESVRYYMGQLQEERKHYDEAELWYRSVGRGENYLSAQGKVAQMMAKQGRLDEGLAYLEQVQVANNQQRAQLVMAEAQLLREAGRNQEAYDLLGKALEKLPNYPDLLYDHAMAAERLDQLDVLEANLRKLIQLKPDHAHAYNALGYTLADRNMRLLEARDLIAQALKLAPEDPFIVDSMGWVEFRLGNFNQSLEYLHRAYRMRADPEIAAHLGEVLWAKGERDEAKRVWQAALKEYPDNETLRRAVKRFIP